ncbi:MAG: hypothetical protein M1135_01025 [Candidatus Omnitrophica bacterium]|nr:hypothetical protein [Candidatus Omnitrophota bacterium]
MEDYNIPETVYIYNEGIKHIKFQELKKFILDNSGIHKVRIIRLKEKLVLVNGIILNLSSTNKKFWILPYSRDKNICHVIITEKIFATLDEFKKPHIRPALFSEPSIISIPGIVEGPAKPKEYYTYKERYMRVGIWELKKDEIKEKFKGEFIDYKDKRITEVLKGYISQALFFYVTGYPFCEDKDCRGFNSHWQKDLIHSQIESGKFCKTHKKIIEKIKNKI